MDKIIVQPIKEKTLKKIMEQNEKKTDIKSIDVVSSITKALYTQYKELVENLESISDELANSLANHPATISLLCLEKEVEKANKAGEKIDISDVLNYLNPESEILEAITEKDGTPIENPYQDIINKAKNKAAQEIVVFRKIQENRPPQITISTKALEKVEYPIDRPNSIIWAYADAEPIDGQLALEGVGIHTVKSNKDAIVVYAIDFKELENVPGLKITQNLTAFDKRCYIAASALFNEGNTIITIAQIHAAMGNNGKPSAAQIAKINDSLTKMVYAHLYLDSTEESKRTNYKPFRYDAPLLPMERISAVVNGQVVNSAIHLFKEPPLVTFAKERKQFTTITRELLATPLNKTEDTLRLEDYLVEQISRIKNSKGKTSNKMLYSTIFKRAGIVSQKQMYRAKDKIKKILNHYEKCGFIKSYTETENADGVKITY